MPKDVVVHAGCDRCGTTITAVVRGGVIAPEVAEFFRLHLAHATPATQGGPGAAAHRTLGCRRARTHPLRRPRR